MFECIGSFRFSFSLSFCFIEISKNNWELFLFLNKCQIFVLLILKRMKLKFFIYQHNKTPARKRNITHKAKNKTRQAKKYCLLNKCEFLFCWAINLLKKLFNVAQNKLFDTFYFQISFNFVLTSMQSFIFMSIKCTMFVSMDNF